MEIERIKTDLINRLSNGEELEDIADNIHQEIDSWLPVYNYQIIEEWKEMPIDYTDRGAEELGASEYNIIKLMTLDLYLYYNDIISEIIEEIKEEKKEEEYKALYVDDVKILESKKFNI